MTKWMVIGMLALVPAAAAAQEPAEQVHDELRALRKELVEALEREDIDKAVAICHPDVVITWQSGEVGRGRTGVKSYLEKMMAGPNAIVKSYKPEVTVDELTKLHGGDAGVATGGSIDRFELSNGMKFDLADRWTAFVVKEGGKWQIAALHVSANVFDNAILSEVTHKMYWIAGFSILTGVFLGFMIGRALKRPAPRLTTS